MTDVPQDLLQQIKDFEEMFTVDTARLKKVVDHFVKELEKGQSLPFSICNSSSSDQENVMKLTCGFA
jgi:hexokinase